MNIPTIKDVLAMDDKELSDFLGQDKQRQVLREELEELDALTGEARKNAETMWVERLAPNIDSHSVRWIKEDAIREANPKKVLNSSSPDSVF